MKLAKTFYTRPDVVEVAQDLLGKFLVTNLDGVLTSVMIVETEAYSGKNDKASHSYNGKRTKRTEMMFCEGGRAYVYLCYGIHHLFNVTTNQDGFGDAVLIRAGEPIDGLKWMLKRRNFTSLKTNLTAGPGALAQSLGITTELYGQDLSNDIVWIEDRQVDLDSSKIVSGPRVGVDYAEEDAAKPWRFVIQDSIWMSKPRI